jgi:hypothetical protein
VQGSEGRGPVDVGGPLRRYNVQDALQRGLASCPTVPLDVKAVLNTEVDAVSLWLCQRFTHLTKMPPAPSNPIRGCVSIAESTLTFDTVKCPS